MPEPAIQIEKLTFGYHAGEKALDALDLEVRDGECLGIVGPNGAGKTTLVLTLAGFCMPDSGSVRILGQDLRRENLAGIRARMGFVLQNLDDQLFMPTVLEDVTIGPLKVGLPPAEAEAKAIHLLERMGLAPLANEFPGHLSAGQKRLSTLATALIQDPELLILDEPTLYLDPYARRIFIEQVRPLPHTRLVISHDLEMVLELCTRIVILDHGRIAAAGLPNALLADPALMAAHRLEVPHSLRRPNATAMH